MKSHSSKEEKNTAEGNTLELIKDDPKKETEKRELKKTCP